MPQILSREIRGCRVIGSAGTALRIGGRIIACGGISGYNEDEAVGAFIGFFEGGNIGKMVVNLS